MIFKKDKKEYCKFCGLELEKDECTCESFLIAKKTKTNTNKIIKCDTCGRKIDADSKFCPYCGLPIKANGNIPKLKKELQGEFAEDVLVKYGIKTKFKLSKTSKITIVLLILLLIALFIKNVVLPIVDRYKKAIEETVAPTIATMSETIPETETSIIIPTEQQIIEKHKNWKKSEGYYYCFDDEGNPIVDDWVKEVDEDGNEKYYYFDIEGKLVVNSWIDGEYYVGSDGAMLRDTNTPDGAYVDTDGKVVINSEEDKIRVEKETQVYYEAPNSEETKASNQKSGLSGILKGVDATKAYEMYISDIVQVRETVTKDNEKCNITCYYPVVKAAKEKEEINVNKAIIEKYNTEFMPFLKQKMLNDLNGLPKGIVLNTVDQRQINSNRFMFIISGKITPRRGLTEKVKYRFTYDRKAKTIAFLEIPAD